MTNLESHVFTSDELTNVCGGATPKPMTPSNQYRFEQPRTFREAFKNARSMGMSPLEAILPTSGFPVIWGIHNG